MFCWTDPVVTIRWSQLERLARMYHRCEVFAGAFNEAENVESFVGESSVGLHGQGRRRSPSRRYSSACRNHRSDISCASADVSPRNPLVSS